MNDSVLATVEELKSAVEQLVFDIGQGCDYKSLHSSALALLLKTNDLKNDLEAVDVSVHPTSGMSPTLFSADTVNAKEVSKVTRKMPKWASNPQQINSKILSLYLYLLEQHPLGVTEAELKDGYGNDSEFDRNFPQMKSISPKNHGKVFDSNHRYVEIWNPVRSAVKDYADKVIQMNFEQDLENAQKAFKEVFGCEGKRFGVNSSPMCSGVSDGNEGVQWNLAVDGYEGVTRLGVNLEGMKYDDWPIAHFLEKEISNPSAGLLALSDNSTISDEIIVRLVRDAWQVTARPSIREKIIGGRYESLAEITSDRWQEMVQAAYECLDEGRSHKARATQTVTMEKSGEQKLMEVSPHLTITVPVWRVGPPSLAMAIDALRTKKADMQLIYDCVAASSRT